MPVNLIPKFCNGAMDSQNNRQDGELLVDIGSRIKCSEHFATVKYIGEVQGHKGTWYGVEWDDPARGKHDGSVDGIQYFKTSGPKSGSFIRPNKIEPLVTCAEAVKKCYGDKEVSLLALGSICWVFRMSQVWGGFRLKLTNEVIHLHKVIVIVGSI